MKSTSRVRALIVLLLLTGGGMGRDGITRDSVSAEPLRNLDDERLFRLMIEDVQDQRGVAVQNAAKQELRQRGTNALGMFVRYLEHPCAPGAQEIQEIVTGWDSNAIPLLLEYCGSTTNRQTRRALVYFMGLMRNKDAAPACLRELGDARNRSTALWALGNCGVTASLVFAREWLRESSQEMVRVRAAGVLGKIGETQDVAVLVQALACDRAWNVRCAAAGALLQHGAYACNVLTARWSELGTNARTLARQVLEQTTNFNAKCSRQ